MVTRSSVNAAPSGTRGTAQEALPAPRRLTAITSKFAKERERSVSEGCGKASPLARSQRKRGALRRRNRESFRHRQPDVDHADVLRGPRLPVPPIWRGILESVILAGVDRDIVSARRVGHVDVDAGGTGTRRSTVECVGLWAGLRVQTKLKLIEATWTTGVVDRVVKCYGHWIRAGAAGFDLEAGSKFL
jgi:hypothetical protein